MPPNCTEIGDSVRVCLTRTQQQALFPGQAVLPDSIGSGIYGSAFPHDTDRVVKLTTDPRDVANLTAAQGSRYAVRVDAVYRLPQGGRRGPHYDESTPVPLFAVVAERLTKLPSEIRYASRPWRVAEGVLREHAGRPTACKLVAMEASDTRLCEDVVKAFVDLRRHGVEWEDRHGGNVGIDRHGNLKVLDMGAAPLPTGRVPAPPVLERRRRRA